MKAFIYVISGEHGRQKIGVSDKPKNRIRELQTGSPFRLRFEFVGEVEAGAAGQVEVEAHFMLNPHKSPGGDEWFAVPPDVAITAVMSAAHRLGYRVRPVDPDASPQGFDDQPWWVTAAMIPAAGLMLYWLWFSLAPRISSGEMPISGGALEAVIFVGLLLWFRRLVRRIGIQVMAYFQSFA